MAQTEPRTGEFLAWIKKTVVESAEIAWKGGVAAGITAGVEYLTKAILQAEQGVISSLLQYIAGIG